MMPNYRGSTLQKTMSSFLAGSSAQNVLYYNYGRKNSYDDENELKIPGLPNLR
jgi:hypothetical protein